MKFLIYNINDFAGASHKILLIFIFIILSFKHKPSFRKLFISLTNWERKMLEFFGLVSPWYTPIGNGLLSNLSIFIKIRQNWLPLLFVRGSPSILTDMLTSSSLKSFWNNFKNNFNFGPKYENIFREINYIFYFEYFQF